MVDLQNNSDRPTRCIRPITHAGGTVNEQIDAATSTTVDDGTGVNVILRGGLEAVLNELLIGGHCDTDRHTQ